MEKMNFNHLQIFHKVAELEHFTRAAEELFISQPAVSKQVQELEKSLGMPLFRQVGRKVYLTEAGQLLYSYTSRIFALAAEAELALQELQGLERGHLAIGASTTIGIYLLPPLLGHYKNLYPKIELSLNIGNADEIQERLMANRLEIGLVEGFVTHPELEKTVWREDELVLIVPPGHHLLAKPDLTLAGLLETAPNFILREKGSGTRAVLEKAIEERGELANLKPMLELGSTEAIKQAVRAGLGISFVSEHTVKLEVAAELLRVAPLKDFTLKRPLFLVYLKAKRYSRAVEAFIRLLNLPGY
jgi:DNA-binding transcriptional LysR family regulator